MQMQSNAATRVPKGQIPQSWTLEKGKDACEWELIGHCSTRSRPRDNDNGKSANEVPRELVASRAV